MVRAVYRLMAPLQRRVMLMVGRAVLRAVNDDLKLQEVQVTGLDGEVLDGVERFQGYGLTSHPHPGAEAVVVFVGGNRGHGLAIQVDDRRYRLAALQPGEVALYDDLGQQVHLTRDGVVIRGAGRPITVTDTPLLRVEADLQVTGEVTDRCDGDGRSMAGMREVYNTHTHPAPSGGTGAPNEVM